MEKNYIIVLVGITVLFLVDYFGKMAYARNQKLRERKYLMVTEKILTIRKLISEENTEGATYKIRELAEECSAMKPKVFSLFDVECMRRIGEIVKKKNGPYFDFRFPLPFTYMLNYDFASGGEMFFPNSYVNVCPPQEEKKSPEEQIKEILLDYFGLK
jgi:hypothetical protein